MSLLQSLQQNHAALQRSIATNLKSAGLATLAQSVAVAELGTPTATTTSGTTTVSPTGKKNGGLNESDKVGLGVGIGIGVPFGIAGLMFWRRQRAAQTHTQPLQQSFLSPTDQDLDGHYSEL